MDRNWLFLLSKIIALHCVVEREKNQQKLNGIDWLIGFSLCDFLLRNRIWCDVINERPGFFLLISITYSNGPVGYNSIIDGSMSIRSECWHSNIIVMFLKMVPILKRSILEIFFSHVQSTDLIKVHNIISNDAIAQLKVSVNFALLSNLSFPLD